jgi:hypothetical protein
MKSNNPIKIALTCVALTVGSAVAEEAASRMWTDKQGRQVEAIFLGLEGDNISLQTKDGRTFTFAMANLSAEDQNFAKAAKPSNVPGYVATNATVGQAANAIDVLVARGLERAAVIVNKNNADITANGGNESDLRNPPKPNPLMSDEQFVRRVYLDIVGRIPSYEEARAFLDDTSGAVKRAKLIDKLLDDPGHSSHMFNYFADMLRVRDDLNTGNGNFRGTPYINWLRHQVENNVKWDTMVFDMLTAKGKMWTISEEERKAGKVAGAAGYLLRDIGMPLDNLANTLAVFLGTDVSCAQCHDHPFADWTQYQFYEMAAFFGATTTDLRTAARRMKAEERERERQMALRSDIDKIITESGGDADRERTPINQFLQANRYVVSDISENTIKLPHDYQYKDHKPYDPVDPKFITWSERDKSLPAYKQKLAKEEGLRTSFGKWVVDPSNPRFAMAIANRMWKRAFGMAVAEPVTNIDDVSKASNPELLMHLANEMKRVKFDLKEFMRIIYNTRSYQRQATTEMVYMGEPYYFQGPLLRRMTAEQAWDSYMTLWLGKPDAYGKSQAQEDLYAKSIDLDLANPKLDAKTVLMKYAAMRNYTQKMRAMNRGEGMMDEGMMAEGGDEMMMGRTQNVGGMTLLRASELDQPTRGGHFLSEFGQSQRMLIDGAGYGGSVPQVLMLMNGDAQQMLTSSSSPLLKRVGEYETEEQKIESLFLSIMNRKPSDQEMALAKKTIAQDASNGYASIVWALVNTREFIFVQ